MHAEVAARPAHVATRLPDHVARELTARIEARRQAEAQIRVDDQVAELHAVDRELLEVVAAPCPPPQRPTAQPVQRVRDRMSETLAAIANALHDVAEGTNPLI